MFFLLDKESPLTKSPQDRQQLINRRALQSLRDEMQLQSSLDRSSWVSVHSHHYFDSKEKVWRELDAVASRLWMGTLQERQVRVKVVLLVESKSLAEKHVLLPPCEPLRQAVIRDWLGAFHREEERAVVYEEAGIDRRLAREIDRSITESTSEFLPNSPIVLRPPAAEWDAAAFVEKRNGQKGSDKAADDLGSSVIWRARLTLQSAARAIAETEVNSTKPAFRLALRFARLEQVASKAEDFNLLQAALNQMQQWPFTATIFHPMVVVDSDIWGVSVDDVVPIRHARVHLTGVSRYPYYWFDLVHRDVADDVITAAQEGYNGQAMEKGLASDEPTMGSVDCEIVSP